MCLFFDMFCVKTYRNLSVGGVFPYHREYFPYAVNLELLFCSTAIFEKKKKKKSEKICNIIYFISL